MFCSYGPAVMDGQASPLFSAGRTPPSPHLLEYRGQGPTYIASDTHTLGSWDVFFMKFYSCYCGGRAGDHLGWLKKPSALPSAVSTNYSGTMALSPSYGQDIAVEPDRGHSFMVTSILTTGLSGGGVIRACLYLVGSPEDELWLRLLLLLGPWPDSFMCCSRAWRGTSSSLSHLSGGSVALIISSTTSGVGVVFVIGMPWP
jgi:hypothetical protein